MELSVQQLVAGIPAISSASRVERVDKGYSEDEKFFVALGGKIAYVLRVAPIVALEHKTSEHRILSELEALGVRASRPIAVGVIEGTGLCYQLLSYLDGEDAEDVLAQYPEDVQFQIGWEAGRDLAQMHRLSSGPEVGPWFDRKLQKHRRYMEAYRNCGVRIKGDDRLEKFIQDRLPYMENRPNLFQHDDFHVGNLIVKNQQYVGVVDFGRYDWGDPVHEFLKVEMFSREVSVPFSIGQIVGYHKGNDIPAEFWERYSLYTAMCIFASVVWTLKVAPDELDEMLDRLYRVLEDHKNFELVKPIWFLEN